MARDGHLPGAAGGGDAQRFNAGAATNLDGSTWLDRGDVTPRRAERVRV